MVEKNIEKFFAIVAKGDVKGFEDILKKSHKSLILLKNKDGNNMIHLAAEHSNGNIIKAFEAFMKEHKEIKFNINDMNNFGQTPLDIANLQKDNVIKALENLSLALNEPLYTSESLRVLSSMQINDFVNSDFDIKENSNIASKKKIERIF